MNDPLGLGKHLNNYSPDEIEQALEQASQIARSKRAELDAEHEARHGSKRIWVERRPGYRGRRVCAQCYAEGTV